MNFTMSLSSSFNQAVQKLFPDVPVPSNVLKRGRSSDFDWAGAFPIANTLKKPVDEVAGAIAKAFTSNDATVSVDKGIIKVGIKVDAIVRGLGLMDSHSHLGVDLPPRKRVVVDFSSPNIAKELHVGHLRSTIIGESIARVQEFLNHNVLRLNHVGDWGTQFGMLICHLTEKKVNVPSLDLPQLMDCYRAAKKQFDEDPVFKKNSREAVTRLQGGDNQSIAIWKQICEVSRTAFQKIYDHLDVTIQERGESYYNSMLEPVVQDLLQRKIAQISDGALCVFTDGHPSPFMLQKADGGYTYDTTDLAALKQRTEEEKADRIIYVVDEGQSDHFKQLQMTGEKAGYLDPKKTEFNHVGFGVVLGPDGQKYKTRSGEVALLRDLLDEAIQKAQEELELRGIKDLESAKTLGIGALKYADLKGARQNNYKFDAERMLDFKGNTAAYLLYSLVRMRAIQGKIGKEDVEAATKAPFNLSEPAEIALGLHLLSFAEIIPKVDERSEPHHLCEFLFVLAEKVNSFYRDCRVIEVECKDEATRVNASRLHLCKLAEKVLDKGLFLLGIRTLEKM